MGFMFVNFDVWPWMARRSCLFGTIIVYFDSNLEGGWKKDEKSTSRLYTSHQACPVLQIQKCFYPGLNSIHWVEAVWWSSIPMGMKRYGLSHDRCLSSSAVGCSDCSNGDGTDHSPAAATRMKHTETWCFLLILAIILIGPGWASGHHAEAPTVPQQLSQRFVFIYIYRYWTRI